MSGASGGSPVIEVTANTSLSALPPQLHHTQAAVSTHTHLLIHTHHVCIVWWGMTSPHTHTNTPKQLQHGQSPGPAGTDGVSWELTACPAALKPCTHSWQDAAKMGCRYQYDLKKIYTSPEKLKALKEVIAKKTTAEVLFSVPLWRLSSVPWAYRL